MQEKPHGHVSSKLHDEFVRRYATEDDGVRWTAADLDRCEHGRHSIDHCADCGPGVTPSNGFLLGSVGWRSRTRYVDGRLEVRIGTMARGEPIWVVVRDKPRS